MVLYIELETLFSYRQRIDYPIEYYFDRRTYTIVDSASKLTLSNECYERYIPLFQIDEFKIQDDYIQQLNNKIVLYKYNRRDVCFEEFIQRHLLWDDWWNFYKNIVYQIAKEWCKCNNLQYKCNAN